MSDWFRILDLPHTRSVSVGHRIYSRSLSPLFRKMGMLEDWKSCIIWSSGLCNWHKVELNEHQLFTSIWDDPFEFISAFFAVSLTVLDTLHSIFFRFEMLYSRYLTACSFLPRKFQLKSMTSQRLGAQRREPPNMLELMYQSNLWNNYRSIQVFFFSPPRIHFVFWLLR